MVTSVAKATTEVVAYGVGDGATVNGRRGGYTVMSVHRFVPILRHRVIGVGIRVHVEFHLFFMVTFK